MKTTEIKVEIGDVDIDDRWVTFEYKVFIGVVLKGEGEHQSEHAWANDKRAFRTLLEDEGYAAELALGEVFN